MIQPLLRFRCRLLVYCTHTIALPLMKRWKMYRSGYHFPYSAAQLRQLRPGTVGYDLITALDANGHHLIPHYENHDIKHIVFGYPMTEKGEVCMQFFMLGNGMVSFPILATVGMGLLTMPEYYPALFRAFRRGWRTASLAATDWFGLVENDTRLVQQTLLISATR